MATRQCKESVTILDKMLTRVELENCQCVHTNNNLSVKPCACNEPFDEIQIFSHLVWHE